MLRILLIIFKCFLIAAAFILFFLFLQHIALTCFAPHAINLHLFLKLSPRRCCDCPQAGDHAQVGAHQSELSNLVLFLPKGSFLSKPQSEMAAGGRSTPASFSASDEVVAGGAKTFYPAELLQNGLQQHQLLLTQPLSLSCLRSSLLCSVFQLKHQLELEVNPPLQRIQSNPWK